MLGLVGAQLKYKVENKEIKAGKAVWVDVSDEIDCH
jgi:betaine lipid synthase